MIAPSVYRSAAIALMAALLPMATACAQDTATQFVLLNNGNVLEGAVKQEGGIVTISNGPGRVVQLPVGDVLCWADDRLSLYRYRVDNRQGIGVDVHLADAQWCLRVGLFAAAADELRAAYQIHPHDPRLPAFERRLRHAADAQRSSEAASADADPSTASSDAAISKGATSVDPTEKKAVREKTADDRSAETPRDVSESAEPRIDRVAPGDRPAEALPTDAAQPLDETVPADPIAAARQRTSKPKDAASAVPRHLVNQFTGQLQPLLIHRCGQAGCHGGPSGAAWQLVHGGLATQLPSRMTGDNLESTLRWVDRQQPDISPLLVRATSPHGGASDPPLGPWDAAGIAQLRQWITALAERSAAGSGRGVAAASGDADLAATETPGRALGGATDPQRPMRLPPVADPFDPDVFNRMYHPSPAE